MRGEGEWYRVDGDPAGEGDWDVDCVGDGGGAGTDGGGAKGEDLNG